MILRAIFWVGVVIIFMPRDPDLGFGRTDLDIVWSMRDAILENLGRVRQELNGSASQQRRDFIGEIIGRASPNAAGPVKDKIVQYSRKAAPVAERVKLYLLHATDPIFNEIEHRPNGTPRGATVRASASGK